MDNIKESGQSEGEAEENSALEVQWRFIQTLVSELNITKASNRKLMGELHQAKMEIQVLRASLDSYTEGGLQPGAIAGTVHVAVCDCTQSVCLCALLLPMQKSMSGALLFVNCHTFRFALIRKVE